VFALKKHELADAGGELPKVFINVTMQKGRWLFSSLELVCMIPYLIGGSRGLTISTEKDECKDERCVG
jgi:hypothetical protein